MARLVRAFGSPDSLIAFVGEAPGYHEDRLGEPFVGPSGSLLTRLCHSAGISRSSSYYTNVVKERPPNNDISTFIKFNPRTGSASTTQAYDTYEAMLYQEVRSLKANVIVAVGATALWALCRKTGIMKWRGSILESIPELGRRKVIPLIHPAAALRNNALVYVIFADLKRVAQESSSPEITRKLRDLTTTPTFNQALDYLNFLRRHVEKVAYDIEVVNEELYCMSFAHSPTEGMCIPFQRGPQEYFTLAQECTIMRAVARVLEHPGVEKLGQNLSFDNSFMFMRYGIRVRPSLDVMVAQGIAYPDLPKSLAFITSFYTREPYYKDDFKKWNAKAASDDSFRLYNVRDSVIPMEAEPRILDVLQHQDNLETYHSQIALIEPLTYMQARGLRINVEGLRAAAKEAEAEEKRLEEELCKMVGYSINPRSPDQLCELFYVKKKLPPYKSRATGHVTTDALALRRIARKGHDEANLILRIRRLRKLRSTYFEMEFDSDGRMRSSFNPIGAKTGRLSSSKNIFGKGGNEQNLPPEFLQFVIADEGMRLFTVDLAQAENRLVAYIAPEPNMIRAFEEGIDLHRQTASLLFGKPISEISDEPGSSPIGGGVYSERFWGKKCVVGSTEVLTPEGWRPIQDWRPERTQIAEWDSKTSEIRFVTATNLSIYSSDVIELVGRNSHVIGTPNHKIPLRRKDKGTFKAVPLALIDSDPHYGIPTTGYLKSDISLLSAQEVKLLVAFQADGSFNGKGHAFRFSKQRKIDRLEEILQSLCIPYTKTKPDDLTYIGFRGPFWLTKQFNSNLLSLGQDQLQAFIEELPYWDGHVGKNGARQYFSTSKENAEWVQTIAHLSGYTALIEERQPKGFGKKLLYVVHFNNRNQNATLTSQVKIPLDGPQLVFGPEVPSGYFLIRSMGKISVTGNSNHSLNYDLSYKAFALICEILDAEAKIIVEKYHAAYPGVRQYHAWVRAQLRENRTITNLFGRHRVFLGSDDEIAKDAYAQIPQSTVADIINRWGIVPLWEEERFSQVDLLSQVHDSIVFQLPEALPLKAQAKILIDLRACLCSPLEFRGRTFTIPADFKVGLSLAKKKMEDIKLNDYSTVEGLAEHLSTLYREQRASALLPPVDGYLSPGSLDEEEMLTELGDAEVLPEHVYSSGGSEW